MVDLVAQDAFAGLHHRPASREHAVDPVAGVVPERQPDDAALAVGPAQRVVVERLVLLRRAAQEPDLGCMEEPPRKNETVPMIRSERFSGQRSTSHTRLRVNQRLGAVKSSSGRGGRGSPVLVCAANRS